MSTVRQRRGRPSAGPSHGRAGVRGRRQPVQPCLRPDVSTGIPHTTKRLGEAPTHGHWRALGGRAHLHARRAAQRTETAAACRDLWLYCTLQAPLRRRRHAVHAPLRWRWGCRRGSRAPRVFVTGVGQDSPRVAAARSSPPPPPAVRPLCHGPCAGRARVSAYCRWVGASAGRDAAPRGRGGRAGARRGRAAPHAAATRPSHAAYWRVGPNGWAARPPRAVPAGRPAWPRRPAPLSRRVAGGVAPRRHQRRRPPIGDGSCLRRRWGKGERGAAGGCEVWGRARGRLGMGGRGRAWGRPSAGADATSPWNCADAVDRRRRGWLRAGGTPGAPAAALRVEMRAAGGAGVAVVRPPRLASRGWDGGGGAARHLLSRGGWRHGG